MSLLSRLRDRFLRHEGDEPERLPSPDDLALLARPEGEPEALMMQEMLANNGIAAMVRNKDATASRGGAWGAPWAYELWVKRADLRRAREIIGLNEEA